MFEAIITVCALAANGPCRDQLIPGYEAADQASCAAALAADPPELDHLGDLGLGQTPRCVATGAALPVEEVAPGVFVHLGAIAEPDGDNLGDVANLGFVIGETSVAVVDTGSARWIGEALWRAIRAETGLPVSHVVLTHMHPDHVLGTEPFAEAGAQIVAHAGLPRALADRRQSYLESFERLIGAPAFLGTRAVAPDMLVEETAEIDLGGGRILTLETWPAAHSTNDLTVHDAATGTLFAGDLVFDGHVPALDGDLTGWRAVLQELSTRDIARLVPGHGGPVLRWPEGGEAIQRYLGILEADTRAAIAEGQRLGDAVDEIAETEAANWELFDVFNPRNATVAFTELEWE